MCIEELFYGAWVLVDGDESPCQVIGFGGQEVTCLYPHRVRHDVLLSDLRPLVLCSSVLSLFGFIRAKGENVWLRRAGDMRLTVGLRERHGSEECRRCAISGKIACWNEEVRYMHELQRWWNDRVYFPFGIQLDLLYDGGNG